MRKLFRHSLVALCLLVPATAITTISTAPPAAANHEFDFPHWRSGTYPVVKTPSCYVWGNTTNFCAIVEDAAYFWQDRGFTQGYTPPMPQTGYPRCDNIPFNSINVCFVDATHAGLNGNVGYTHPYSWDFNGDPNHMSAAQIFICANCGVPGNTQQQNINYMKATLRHEMGHALGLGHVQDTTCLMNEGSLFIGINDTCQHDKDAMAAMYQHAD